GRATRSTWLDRASEILEPALREVPSALSFVLLRAAVRSHQSRGLTRLRPADSGQNRKSSSHISQRRFRMSRSKPLTKLTGRLTRCLAECPCEISLAGKAERQCNIHQWAIALHQQGFRALEALGADIAMRRLSDCL